MKKILGLAAAATALIAAGTALADPIPPGWTANQVEPIGFTGLQGKFGAFKLALKHAANGRWYLYAGHSFDHGWSIVDVTDPARSEICPLHSVHGTRGRDHLAGDAARQSHDHRASTAISIRRKARSAIWLWDISDPENPKTDRRNGRAAPTARTAIPIPAATTPISRPRCRAIDGNVLVILDVSDPVHPKQVGRWCAAGPEGRRAQAGARAGLPRAGEYQPRRQDGLDRLHARRDQPRHQRHRASQADRPAHHDAALHVCGHAVDPHGAAVLGPQAALCELRGDGARLRQGRAQLGRLHRQQGPGEAAPHVDLPGAAAAQGRCPTRISATRAGASGRTTPTRKSTIPTSRSRATSCTSPGSTPACASSTSATRTCRPRLGWFMPPERPDAPQTAGAHASPINWTEEVAVDTRGNIYMDEDKWGIFILRYKGPGQPAPTATQ